jgi:hypothetical protein
MRARVVIVALLLAKPAAADSTDPAAARELFDEGRALMAKGDFVEAEKRLTAALAYSNGRGIKYQLAVCEEKLGHVARAWKLYADVAESARQAGEADRERVARTRAAELSARIPHVHILPTDATITIDGEHVATDAPLAIEPGHHAIHAEQVGHTPWDSTIDARESETLDVRVPALDPIVDAHPSPPAIVLPPPPPPRVVVHATPLSPVRAAGIGISAAGVVALGVGAGFVIASASTYASSSSLCDAADHCTSKGAAIRSDALAYGDVATALIIGGAVSLAGGIVLWLVAPHRARAIAFEPVLRF